MNRGVSLYQACLLSVSFLAFYLAKWNLQTCAECRNDAQKNVNMSSEELKKAKFLNKLN